MTEDGAFNIVRAWLVRLAADAIVLDPLRAPLGEIIRDHQDGPRPEGAYATINLLGSDDLEEVRCEEFRAVEVEIEGEPLPVERFALKSTRAVEFRFRIDVFASRPMEWIRLFRTAAMAGDMQVDLLPLVVRDVGEAQRIAADEITAILAAQREQRAPIEAEQALLRNRQELLIARQQSALNTLHAAELILATLLFLKHRAQLTLAPQAKSMLLI
jgi:hypothetical protein